MNRFCLDCRKELLGRRDKKFCNDACRSNYNNRKNAELQHEVRLINQILKRNRHILLSLNPSGKTKVLRDKMNDLGFNFHYFTSMLETSKGDRYLFCYDQGYLSLNEKEVLLVYKIKE